MWEYINRSQKHECRNWDLGRAVPFLGIFVSNFRYCVFGSAGEQSTAANLAQDNYKDEQRTDFNRTRDSSNCAERTYANLQDSCELEQNTDTEGEQRTEVSLKQDSCKGEQRTEVSLKQDSCKGEQRTEESLKQDSSKGEQRTDINLKLDNSKDEQRTYVNMKQDSSKGEQRTDVNMK